MDATANECWLQNANVFTQFKFEHDTSAVVTNYHSVCVIAHILVVPSWLPDWLETQI
jgi:hypothetical protein